MATKRIIVTLDVEGATESLSFHASILRPLIERLLKRVGWDYTFTVVSVQRIDEVA